MNIQHYLNERVEGQINYYSQKGGLNKTYYLRFKVAQMVAAALLPFASVFITEFVMAKYIVAFLGTMVTILEGILAIGKYHEKWVTYRATAEALQQEKFIFLMQAGPYVGRGAGTTFVNRIEMMLGKENQGWQKMALSEPLKQEKKSEAEAEETENLNSAETANPETTETTTNDDGTSTSTTASAPIDPAIGVASDTELVAEETESALEETTDNEEGTDNEEATDTDEATETGEESTTISPK